MSDTEPRGTLRVCEMDGWVFWPGDVVLIRFAGPDEDEATPAASVWLRHMASWSFSISVAAARELQAALVRWRDEANDERC